MIEKLGIRCNYCSDEAVHRVEHYARNGFWRSLFGLPTRTRAFWVCGIHMLDPFDYARRGPSSRHGWS